MAADYCTAPAALSSLDRPTWAGLWDSRRNRRRHLSASDSALPQGRSQHWAGSGIAILGATTFGLVTTQSRLAYDGGSNTLTVVLVRATTFALLLGAFLFLRSRRARLSRSGFIATLWMAALLMVMSAGYLGAVAYIPVSLAALIFYTFPFYVAVLASLTGREPMTRTKAAALVVAFAGLILALGPSFDELNWRGIACGVAGSLAMGTAVTFGGPVMRQNDALVVNVCTNAWVALGLSAYLATTGGVALPTTGLGWVGIIGATLCYLVAFSAWLLSLRIVDPIRVAILFNIEPVLTITAAWIVLGERLGPIQLLGGLLVIAAIVAMTVLGARRGVGRTR
jgi:drug/metabolite transporter (DMT)-like permease